MQTFQMKDWQNGDGMATDGRPWNVCLSTKSGYHSDGTLDQINIKATHPDGNVREVWVEIQDGNLVIHAYDSEHDEPLNIRLGAGEITTDNDREVSA